MTLSTNVAVRLPAEHNLTSRIVLDKLIEALIVAGGPWAPNLKPGDFFNEEYGPPTKALPVVEESDGRMGTRLGQGFHAITDIRFNADGSPLYMKDQTWREIYPEDYEGDDDSEYGDRLAYPACTYMLDMDTAYGYHSEKGDGSAPGVTGCTSLHAYAIALLHAWVIDQGGSLLWHDEYRGSWHDMEDLDGWNAWLWHDREAQDWFNGSVLPAIATLTR